MREYPQLQAVNAPALHGALKDCLISFCRPAPLGRDDDQYDIGYEAAKRDLLWQLRDIVGHDELVITV